MAGYVTGDLVTDLWWFIENVTDEDPTRHDQFFALRTRVRQYCDNDKPLYPVTDGDEGADIYGYASNSADAKTIAESCFADPISHIEFYGPISLQNGETLPLAYVAITKD